MPVELYAAATTRPDAIFCDTSFIVDLLTNDVPAFAAYLRDVNPGKIARAAESATFFKVYKGAGVRFVSTPYTFQEVSHLVADGALRKAGYRRWRDFDAIDSAASTAAYASMARAIGDAWTRVQAYGIEFSVPQPSSTAHWDEVIEMAILLLTSYPDLNAMDAFHISVGLRSGLTWYASLDSGWKTVAEINVFSAN